jgi:4-hydroxybenzoate polyprenyltransferase
VTWGGALVRLIGVLPAFARFGRLTAAGLGMSCVVIGHASASPALPLGVLIGLLLVGVAFHVVASALYDLFNIDPDRPDPTRARSPLIAGQIPPEVAALVIAATAVASFVIDGVFFGISPPRGVTSGAVALAAAYACLVFYDAFSKRLPVPLVADAVQGVGWACLVWYGAARGGGATVGTFLAELFVVGFVVIVNAVHGGLRDLGNDAHRGTRSGAVASGTTVDADGRVTVPAALRRLAWLLQGGLALVALAAPLGVRGDFGSWFLWYVLCLTATAVAMALLREGLRHAGEPFRFKNLGATHILALWLPLTAITAMFGGPWQGFVALAVMVLPMLGQASFRTALRILPGIIRDLTGQYAGRVAKLRATVADAVAARRSGRP